MNKTLETILTQNPEALCVIKGVFPFTLLPSTLLVEKAKVSLYQSHFPSGTSIRTIAVKDISTTEVETAFPFASIRVLHKYLANEALVITHIYKQHAERAKKILDGLIVASREGVDMLQTTNNELPEKLEAVGSIPSQASFTS